MVVNMSIFHFRYAQFNILHNAFTRRRKPSNLYGFRFFTKPDLCPKQQRKLLVFAGTSASEVHARITQVYRGAIHVCQCEWMPTQDLERFSYQLGPGGGCMVGTCQIYLWNMFGISQPCAPVGLFANLCGRQTHHFFCLWSLNHGPKATEPFEQPNLKIPIKSSGVGPL